MNNLKIKKDNFIEENKYIFNKFMTLKQIANGSCGNIYSVMRLNDKKLFAMKVQKININTHVNTLEIEAYFLLKLKDGFGFPKLISYGQRNKNNILIETLLDKSLHDIFIFKNISCNIIDVCLIGLQIIERLEWIHSKNIVYRNIKTKNCLIGKDLPNIIYIIDFSLCKNIVLQKQENIFLKKILEK